MTNSSLALSTATAEQTVKRGPGRPRLYSDSERVNRARLATRRSQAKRQNAVNESLTEAQTRLSGINVSRLNAEGKANVEAINALLDSLLEKFPQVEVEEAPKAEGKPGEGSQNPGPAEVPANDEDAPAAE